MEELIHRLNEHGVRYLVIGGQAMRLVGMPRTTMDWDLYIPPRDHGNIEKLNKVLVGHLDVPVLPLGDRGENFIQTYQTDFGVLQFHLGGIGLPPFDEADARAVIRTAPGGVPIRMLNPLDLLESKKKAGRPQDQDDVLYLEKKKELGRL